MKDMMTDMAEFLAVRKELFALADDPSRQLRNSDGKTIITLGKRVYYDYSELNSGVLEAISTRPQLEAFKLEFYPEFAMKFTNMHQIAAAKFIKESHTGFRYIDNNLLFKISNEYQSEAVILGFPLETALKFSNEYQIDAVNAANISNNKDLMAFIDSLTQITNQYQVEAIKLGLPLSEALQFSNLHQIAAAEAAELTTKIGPTHFMLFLDKITNQYQPEAIKLGLPLNEAMQFSNEHQIAVAKAAIEVGLPTSSLMYYLTDIVDQFPAEAIKIGFSFADAVKFSNQDQINEAKNAGLTTKISFSYFINSLDEITKKASEKCHTGSIFRSDENGDLTLVTGNARKLLGGCDESDTELPGFAPSATPAPAAQSDATAPASATQSNDSEKCHTGSIFRSDENGDLTLVTGEARKLLGGCDESNTNLPAAAPSTTGKCYSTENEVAFPKVLEIGQSSSSEVAFPKVLEIGQSSSTEVAFPEELEIGECVIGIVLYNHTHALEMMGQFEDNGVCH